MLNAPRPATLPLPRRWTVRACDLGALPVGIAVLIVLMWVRHGGASELGSPAGVLTAAGQLTALLGTYAALVQLVLVSRSPFLDQVVGPDRLAVAHRWLGFATAWLIASHVLLTTTGFALGEGRTCSTRRSRSSGRTLPAGGGGRLRPVPARHRHLRPRRTAPAVVRDLVRPPPVRVPGVALAFAHQLVVGADFVDDPVAVAFWVGLYVATAALVLVFRFGQPLALARRHRFRVANVVVEAPGVVSIYVTGRELDRLAVRAGQFFLVRLLTRDGWWRAHPFSLSAAPNGRFLRFTVKDLGDWSGGRLQRLPIGTRLVLEGPYGILTGARRTRPKVLLVAGGVGITPLRALLEALPGRPGDLALVYRARRPEDVVFRAELEAIARARGATHPLPRRPPREPPSGRIRSAPARWPRSSPTSPSATSSCAARSRSWIAAGRRCAAWACPASQIHLERFAY